MDPNETKPITLKTIGSGTTSGSLSVMYVLAVVLLLLGSLVIVALMFVPPDWRDLLGSEPNGQVYVPGSQPGFVPLSADAGLDEPAGVYPLERGRYRVVIVAYNWEFEPKEIRLPLGAEVEFVARSDQDYHGVAIANTDVVFQLFPNHASRVRYVFDRPGEYPFVCAEYCGAGHLAMSGKIIVE